MGRKVESHWTGLDPQPDIYRGFVYEITNLVTGMKYIGKKVMWYKGKKGKTKGKKIYYQWKTYTGSSSWLNDDIEKLGKENFKFEIVQLHKSKSGLKYAEAERIINSGALTWNRDKYYNGGIERCNTPNEYYKDGVLIEHKVTRRRKKK